MQITLHPQINVLQHYKPTTSYNVSMQGTHIYYIQNFAVHVQSYGSTCAVTMYNN